MGTSDFTQLQVDKLVSEVRVNYEKQLTRVQRLLGRLKEIINNIPDRGPLSVQMAKRILRQRHDIAIPFPDFGLDDSPEPMLEYAKPSGINIVGSYARQTSIKTKDSTLIDIAVTIPFRLLQDKDYLNHRYFIKRAYYIACIAAGLREHQDDQLLLHFAYQNDHYLQPVLILNPTEKSQVGPNLDDGAGSLGNDLSSLNVKIRIIIATSQDVFLVNKTWPWNTCVRSSPEAATSSKPVNNGTPFYNGTLMAECSVEYYTDVLRQAYADSEPFKGACTLGSLWLRQRNFGAGTRRGGFGAFENAIVMYFLVKGDNPQGRPVIPQGHNSFQLFRAFLKFMSSSNLIQEPWTKHTDATKISLLKSSRSPVFFDGSRTLNIFYKMTPWSYSRLRHEAQTTLDLINASIPDQVRLCFVSKIDRMLFQFDEYVKLEIPQEWKGKSGLIQHDENILDFCTKAHEVLTTALSTRIKLLYPLVPASGSWSITESGPSLCENAVVTFGFLINAEQMAQVVERGPPAEERNAAAAFRKFWGEKAELRRFKDGSILESLIWTDDKDNGNIFKQIVNHVAKRHLGQEVASGLSFVANDFHHLLPMQPQQSPSSLTTFQPLQKAFSVLETQIRELKGIPLQIRRIAPACANLRYTSVIPQYTHSTPKYIQPFQPMNIVLQFEGSARWPDDIFAIQRTKTALLLRIAELLEEVSTGLSAKVGVENNLQAPFLDVVYPNTAAFRLLIHHDREQTLLERQLKDRCTTTHARNQASAALADYKRDFIQAPLHTQTLASLCTRFPMLSASVRLVKQWCNSHLLSPHISEEYLELLTANTFIHPQPWQAPGSIRTGFLRTLAFVAKWDWRSEPLIVDFSGIMTSDERYAINIRFEAWRKTDPAMNRTVLFAASNVDPEGITWTQRGPIKVVAARFTYLARAAVQTVENDGLKLDSESLFNHSTSDYDFIIHLDQEALGRMRDESTQSSYKNIALASAADGMRGGFDPVQLFILELGHIHGESMVLFYNDIHPKFIAVLWTPKSEPRSLKPNLAFSTLPTSQLQRSGGDARYQVTINHQAILGDIARLGGDMVLRIETRK